MQLYACGKTSPPAAALISLSCLALACSAEAASLPVAVRARAAAGSGSFAVVVLPDTQYYAAEHPEILEAQARWIVEERSAGEIALVIHEGDLVDGDEPRQWERAARSLHELDGLVPYILSVGNHDYHRDGPFVTRRTLVNDYFSAATSAPGLGPSGTFEPGRIENSFQVVEPRGRPWLILSLEFGPRGAVLEWADAVAKDYADHPAIVVTHAYLDAHSTRFDHVLRPEQPWSPRAYLAEAQPDDVNDGEEIWQKLIVRNDNILFVLCGHDLGDGVGRLTSKRPDGTKVEQLLANYQTGPLGGSGYLRLMRFFPDRHRVAVETYSPFLDRFKTGPENQFELAY